MSTLSASRPAVRALPAPAARRLLGAPALLALAGVALAAAFVLSAAAGNWQAAWWSASIAFPLVSPIGLANVIALATEGAASGAAIALGTIAILLGLAAAARAMGALDDL